MTLGKPKSNGGPASPADDSKPDLKWVVEWLVGREGQRRTAALLGVNRKTVALSLRRERLTGRMTLAVQRLMANLDDPGWERTTPLDRLEARMRLAVEAVDDLARLVERLTRRVEVLEAARQPEDDVGDQASKAADSSVRPISSGSSSIFSKVTSTGWPELVLASSEF